MNEDFFLILDIWVAQMCNINLHVQRDKFLGEHLSLSFAWGTGVRGTTVSYLLRGDKFLGGTLVSVLYMGDMSQGGQVSGRQMSPPFRGGTLVRGTLVWGTGVRGTHVSWTTCLRIEYCLDKKLSQGWYVSID